MNERTQEHNDFFKSEILQLEKEQSDDLKNAELIIWCNENEPMSEEQYFNQLAIKYEGGK